jgi:glycosyltransferase involved in cell wall biosynthesis
MALHRAKFVHAICPAEGDIVRRIAPKARVHILPNAAYSSQLTGVPQRPERKPAVHNGLLFGYCSRFEIDHKGIDLLIEGFSTYRKAGGRGHLEMIGTGPAGSRIEDLVTAHDLSGIARVLGPRFGRDKERAMWDWRFFVLTSRFDVMPTACLEAALAGLPVVVTRETNIATYVEEYQAGVTVGALTADAIAEALFAAERIPPERWHAISENAYRMAVEISDWTRVAATLNKLYREP